MAPSGGPESASEGSAYQSSGASKNGIRRSYQSAKKCFTVVCLQFPDGYRHGGPDHQSHSQADQRIAQAMTASLDGNATDPRPREGLRAGSLHEHEIAIGDAFERADGRLGTADSDANLRPRASIFTLSHLETGV